jgi:hypothetical protein
MTTWQIAYKKQVATCNKLTRPIGRVYFLHASNWLRASNKRCQLILISPSLFSFAFPRPLSFHFRLSLSFSFPHAPLTFLFISFFFLLSLISSPFFTQSQRGKWKRETERDSEIDPAKDDGAGVWRVTAQEGLMAGMLQFFIFYFILFPATSCCFGVLNFFSFWVFVFLV